MERREPIKAPVGARPDAGSGHRNSHHRPLIGRGAPALAFDRWKAAAAGEGTIKGAECQRSGENLAVD